MLNTFDKTSRHSQRRSSREHHMARMRELSSFRSVDNAFTEGDASVNSPSEGGVNRDNRNSSEPRRPTFRRMKSTSHVSMSGGTDRIDRNISERRSFRRSSMGHMPNHESERRSFRRSSMDHMPTHERPRNNRRAYRSSSMDMISMNKPVSKGAYGDGESENVPRPPMTPQISATSDIDVGDYADDVSAITTADHWESTSARNMMKNNVIQHEEGVIEIVEESPQRWHVCGMDMSYLRGAKCWAVCVVAGLVLTMIALLLPGDSTSFSLPTKGLRSSKNEALKTRRFEQIKEQILEMGISDVSDMRSHSSPQFKALVWLANEDEMKLDPDDKYLSQRYALAVLWYATHVSEKWEQANGGLTRMFGLLSNAREKSSEVEDTHISTAHENGIRGGGSSSLPTVKWDTSTNWLSGKGICSWYGVECIEKEAASSDDEDESLSTYDDNNYVTKLNLTMNDLDGRMPKELKALDHMRLLDLSDNSLRGTIVKEIGELTKLEDFVLSRNNLEGKIPTTIGLLVKLENLNLSDNTLEGKIPSHIENLTSLRYLRLFENYLNGEIPTQIGKLKDLTALDLDVNNLRGDIPSEIGKLSSAVDIRLGRNNFGGTIPSEIGNLDKLETLYLNHNGIKGAVPSTVSKLESLKEIHLNDNRLTGSLPYKLGLIKDSLERIYLHSNKFSGNIPPEWGDVEGLKYLYLQDNAITGSIPSDLGNLVNLQDFLAHDNHITGTLPTQMGQMSKLKNLHLDKNELKGPIPSEYEELTKLETLYIHDNQINGTVPKGVCNLVDEFELEEFTSDCAGSNPEVTCDCCTNCGEQS